MPENPELKAMADMAQRQLPIELTLYRLIFNLNQTRADGIRYLQDYLTACHPHNIPGSPIQIPLNKNSIRSIGKQLLIQVAPGWIMSIHFALHGHFVPMSTMEYDFTQICHRLNLPPRVPFAFESLNPHRSSLVAVDRNKLTQVTFIFLGQTPFNLYQPADRGPDFFQNPVAFEARILSAPVPATTRTPIYKFINDRYVTSLFLCFLFFSHRLMTQC